MRDDLVALTPEVVAGLTNAGLVRRAQRDNAEGRCPQLQEGADGEVTGTFPDGVVATLPRGVALRDAYCTCGASVVCRHRVAAALAYRNWAEATQQVVVATAVPSPGDVDDETLVRRLGPAMIARADHAVRRGLSVEVVRASAPESVATARLPTANVRFLVPGDLAYVQCDCAVRLDCEHVALAVWAFREADRRDLRAPSLVVALAKSGSPVVDRAADDALDAVLALVEELLLVGVVGASTALSQRIALVRRQLARAGLVWPLIALDDLNLQTVAYRERSARYRASSAAEALSEIAARVLAARRGGVIPAAAVLGRGVALETRLDHLQLVALGARVEADGDHRDVLVFFADPETSSVLVFARHFAARAGEELVDASTLGRRTGTGSLRIATLATGDLVTRVARRRANNLLVLGKESGERSVVTPHDGDFTRLPPPIRVDRIADLAQTFRSRPPRSLRPRVHGEDTHALAVSEIHSVFYDAGTQTLVAELTDAEGQSFRIVRPWRSVAPHALDHLASALRGEQGRVRWITGTVRRAVGGFTVDPLAVAADRLVVVDLEPGESTTSPLITGRTEPSDPLASAVTRALSAIEEGAHFGLQHTQADYRQRLAAAARDCVAVGLETSATQIEEIASALTAADTTADPGVWRAVTTAWIAAAIRLTVVAEELSS